MNRNDVSAAYKKRLNLQKAHFSFIEYEDTLVETVFKVTLENGTQLILKICSSDGEYRREVYFLNHFFKKLPLPSIIQLVPPEPQLQGALLIEYLPGKLLKPEDLNDKLSSEIGFFLARIHLERVKGYGDSTDPSLLNRDPRVPLVVKFKEGLEECAGHLPENLLTICRRYFENDIDLFLSADGPCMVHHDFRPGNLIAYNEKVQGIIDWSSGRGGCAEEEFCFLEGSEWPTSGKKSFLEGYSSIRKVPDYQPLMPLLRLSRAVAAIGFTVKRGTWESNHANFYQFNRCYLESL